MNLQDLPIDLLQLLATFLGSSDLLLLRLICSALEAVVRVRALKVLAIDFGNENFSSDYYQGIEKLRTLLPPLPSCRADESPPKVDYFCRNVLYARILSLQGTWTTYTTSRTVSALQRLKFWNRKNIDDRPFVPTPRPYLDSVGADPALNSPWPSCAQLDADQPIALLGKILGAYQNLSTIHINQYDCSTIWAPPALEMLRGREWMSSSSSFTRLGLCTLGEHLEENNYALQSLLGLLDAARKTGSLVEYWHTESWIGTRPGHVLARLQNHGEGSPPIIRFARMYIHVLDAAVIAYAPRLADLTSLVVLCTLPREEMDGLWKGLLIAAGARLEEIHAGFTLAFLEYVQSYRGGLKKLELYPTHQCVGDDVSADDLARLSGYVPLKGHASSLRHVRLNLAGEGWRRDVAEGKWTYKGQHMDAILSGDFRVLEHVYVPLCADEDPIEDVLKALLESFVDRLPALDCLSVHIEPTKFVLADGDEDEYQEAVQRARAKQITLFKSTVKHFRCKFNGSSTHAYVDEVYAYRYTRMWRRSVGCADALEESEYRYDRIKTRDEPYYTTSPSVYS